MHLDGLVDAGLLLFDRISNCVVELFAFILPLLLLAVWCQPFQKREIFGFSEGFRGTCAIQTLWVRVGKGLLQTFQFFLLPLSETPHPFFFPMQKLLLALLSLHFVLG